MSCVKKSEDEFDRKFVKEVEQVKKSLYQKTQTVGDEVEKMSGAKEILHADLGDLKQLSGE